MFFSGPILRRLFHVYIDKFEGGQFYSYTLRKIFKEVYDIDAGIGTYGCFTTNFRPHVTIGSYCSIAPGVQRLVGNHPMTDVSTHPLFHLERFNGLATRYESHHLTIGNDVWIGVNAVITGNCEHIGNGAVVGAGAIVTHNVAPYTIVAGNPARVIRYRFDKGIQEKLEDTNWFDLSPDELKEAIPYAHSPLDFCDKINEIKRRQSNHQKSC